MPRLLSALLAVAYVLVAAPVAAQPSYLLFEGGPVRPVALSPDGSKLFVVNAPEGHLEIYDVSAGGLLYNARTVPVGMEPVAVAARTNTEVWVVNHLSDSVTVIDDSTSPPRVLRTLLVGDEPRDIVFAGSPDQRAFITTAHRGQHRDHASLSALPSAGAPDFTAEGTGRADVWVFDADDPGGAMGVPDEILTFFSDTPRALATDGSTVYVAAFHSGNQTTTVLQTQVVPSGDQNSHDPNDFASSCAPGTGDGQGVPHPSDNIFGDQAPTTGIIVRKVGSDWVDAMGCKWNTNVSGTNPAVNLDLPDQDVFAVNANTLAAGAVFSGVGTILFNMALNPTTGKLYVSNTESPNHVRFEGPGDHALAVTGVRETVQGRLSESRITVINPSVPSVTPQHLNKHINYALLHTNPGAPHATIDAQVPHSLATPLQLVVHDASQRLYVAAFGSAKVGVYDAAKIEDGSFVPTTVSADQLDTSGGPAGLAINAAGDRLYVYTRFDNELQVFDVSGAPGAPLQTVKLPTAEPDEIIEGRPFLYDAVATSGNGEASCASCHIFGDFDSLAWNLGDPDGPLTVNNHPSATPSPPIPPPDPNFHPMKGPMTTQTLRGLSTHGATHWRGDRATGFFGTDPCTYGQPDSFAPCDEVQSFMNFIVAFEGLVGRETHISTGDMTKFTDFAMELMLPPNPVAELDNSLTTEQQAGLDLYFSCDPGPSDSCIDDQNDRPTDVIEDCDGCHDLDASKGFFGSGGEQTFEDEPQSFKVAHLRNMYTKVGMFGDPESGPLGNQVRGFGFLHDGGIGSLFNFVNGPPFSINATEARELEALMLAFPSDLAPIVGQQVSLGPNSPGSVTGGSHANQRVDRLDAQAGANFTSFVLGGVVKECELIIDTVEGGVQKGYQRIAADTFQPDDGTGNIDEATLRGKADPGMDQDLSFTCVPPGSGQRMGVDRDDDGVFDGLDTCPAWPNQAPFGTCIAGDASLLAARCGADGECGGGGDCALAQEPAACAPTTLPEPSRGWGLALGLGLVAGLRRRALRVH